MKYSEERRGAMQSTSRVVAMIAIFRTVPWSTCSKSSMKGLPCAPTAPRPGTLYFAHCNTGNEAATQKRFWKPVEMALASFDDITRDAERNALRTGVVGTRFALHVKVRLVRLQRYVQVLLHQLPRSLDANPRELNFVAAHAVASVRNPVSRMAQRANGFCPEPRGA